MSVLKDFNKIFDFAHYWNWLPDWVIVKDIYLTNSDSYSVLTPFAYTYLEEMIRTTTSQYGTSQFNREGKPNKIKVGMSLIALAIEENNTNSKYIALLENIKKYFRYKNNDYNENGRNLVLHGHLHPRFWSKESFEELIHDIAKLSKYSKF